MRKIAVAVLAALSAALIAVPAPALAATDVVATEVQFTGAGGEVLHGTVLAPEQAAGGTRRPGIVMLEGAGNRGREYLMPEARAYARHGIVTLVYDKRAVGYSMLQRDYGLLADDALAGLRLLRSRPDVDPARAGLWGLSEGAFVAPIAANRSTDVAFLITVGAVGVTPAAQTAWAYGTYLRHAGVSGSLPRTMRGTTVRTAIGAGIFAEADFDPLPHWEQVRQPVLAQWGRLDRDAVPGKSSRLIREALERGGNTRHAIRIVEATNHNLHRTADDGFDRLPELSADYGDAEARWIADPRQAPVSTGDFGAEPAAPAIHVPAWYGGAVQLVAFLVMLAAFAAYPMVAAVRRVRRRPTDRVSRPARWLAVLGPATVTGTLLYLLVLLATAAKITGPVVLGRPVVWLGLQLLACATVAATLAVAHGLRRHRPADRIRLGLLTVGGLLFVPWAIHWGLLLP
ncbi:prolyl oligopeptidase family serine peptidase [Actinoplanes sp. NBC_00393]|uniref:alpha/beta hydrolase family protein n=1 Tax=Actinoplanes sp. NBC_00393 TaxID=2975953 RepID=UPI002E2033F9